MLLFYRHIFSKDAPALNKAVIKTLLEAPFDGENPDISRNFEIYADKLNTVCNTFICENIS